MRAVEIITVKKERKEALMNRTVVQMSGIRRIMFLLVGQCWKMMHIVTFAHQQCFNYMFLTTRTRLSL